MDESKELTVKEPPEVPGEAPKKKRVVKRKRPTLAAPGTTVVGGQKRYVARNVMLYRGATRIELINDLAEEKFDRQVLAAKYRVQQSDISDFFVEHQFEIGEQKKRIEENLKDEYALLTVHSKVNRVAMYQEQIRLTDEYIAWCETSGRPIPVAIIRLQQTALRSVAEEMGDLKSGLVIENTMVENTINGVDVTKDL